MCIASGGCDVSVLEECDSLSETWSFDVSKVVGDEVDDDNVGDGEMGVGEAML